MHAIARDPVPRPKPAGPTVQGWILPHLVAWLERQGHDVGRIRSLPGFARLGDPDARLPEAAADQAWQIAAKMTSDEAIGVHVVESLPRGALDLVEYAVRASASLSHGLGRLARYGSLVSDRVAARSEASGEGVLVIVRDTLAAPLHRGRMEFAIGLVLKLARDATGTAIVPLRVTFTHTPPADPSEHQRFFGGPVTFNGGSNSILLSAADAALPLQHADAALLDIVRRRLDKALMRRDRANAVTLSGQVQRLLIENFGQRTLTPEAVARSIGVSRRTLSRRLAESGTSFRKLLEDVRAELAHALLQDRTLSVGDIAFFLQYSEPSAFHRSFKRWTGQSPQAFRNASARPS